MHFFLPTPFSSPPPPALILVLDLHIKRKKGTARPRTRCIGCQMTQNRFFMHFFLPTPFFSPPPLCTHTGTWSVYKEKKGYRAARYSMYRVPNGSKQIVPEDWARSLHPPKTSDNKHFGGVRTRRCGLRKHCILLQLHQVPQSVFALLYPHR